MIISVFPHTLMLNMARRENVSLQFFNDTGANSIDIKHGNINDVAKSVDIETTTIVEDVGKIVDLVGVQAKYLFLVITGTGVLEIDIHTKR